MGDRRTGNFIKAFVEDNQDGFVPNRFYLWSAISLLAATLERRVWLPWGPINFYPNMFVFLVSKPGVGKSSAIRPSVKLLRKLDKVYGAKINLLPNKVTEPKLIDLLGVHEFFEYPKAKFNPHTSYYYYASEASTCFSDPYGGFVQTLTALYDGDDLTKATVSRAKTVEVVNPCLNIIAGSTFDYLAKLLTTEGIMGGFASRITYVIHEDKVKRKAKWMTDERGKVKDDTSAPLLHDLHEIFQMSGPFTATPEFQQLYVEWADKFEEEYQALDSEQLQSLIIRKGTMLKKLPMILSAAESSDRVLRPTHWHWALQLMNEVEKGIPKMIRKGQAADTKSQTGIKAAIIQMLNNSSELLSERKLVGKLVAAGFRGNEVKQTLFYLKDGDLIKTLGHALVVTDDIDSQI